LHDIVSDDVIEEETMKLRPVLITSLMAILLMMSGRSYAEVSDLKVAEQYGISYLPLMVMEDQRLIEKFAQEAGVPDLKVTWYKFAGGNVMNESLLSNSLHFASGGVAPFITLWARTKGNYDVKGVAALNSMPLYLVSRNPNVKALKDFTDKDKIALPAVKVSIQAVTLQMAAKQAFGAGQQNKLDPFTVSMNHSDAQIALLSGSGEVTAHFGSPPFQYRELEKAGSQRVLSSYDVLGGPATFNVVWTTSKFRKDNPKIYAAFVKALDEAMVMIGKDKKWAAETYLRVSKDKDTVDNVLAMLNDPEIIFTTKPQNIMKYVDFMHEINAIKIKPDDPAQLFFPVPDGTAGERAG
jgi:NitT/TauT family transport system substrate-binding protein